MLRIVTWQVPTPGKSTAAAVARVASFVNESSSCDVRTQHAAVGHSLAPGVSRSGHPLNRQDEHSFAWSANDGEIPCEEFQTGDRRKRAASR